MSKPWRPASSQWRAIGTSWSTGVNAVDTQNFIVPILTDGGPARRTRWRYIAEMADDAVSAHSAVENFLVTDRVALVTGAGKGIGAGIALLLAEAGADVALVARTKSDLDEVAEGVRSFGRRALVFPADLNDLTQLPCCSMPSSVSSAAWTSSSTTRAVHRRSRSWTRVENLEGSFHFNVSVTFELSRLAVPMLLQRDGASIVNISSVAGHRAWRGGWFTA